MESINKYLEDNRFIQWVLNPNDELDKWWKSFESDNPEEKHNILLARKVLLNLETADKKITKEEKDLMFFKVLKDIDEKQKPNKSIQLLNTVLKYAAVAILFFLIGALLFYKKDNLNPQYLSQNLDEPISLNNAILIRPNSKNILIDEKKSVIEYSNRGNVTVNNIVLDPTTSVKKGVPELNHLIIPYGKTSEVLLSDGTKVYLNAGSRFVYPEYFNDKNREVFLVGEAFFEVKHDEKHPFIVQTVDINIKVLGTQFNVSAYPTDKIIETVLTQGKVRIKQNNSKLFSETVDLKPNQLASFNKMSRETKLMTVDTDNYVLWKDGIFKFESTDLSRVIKKLERFYSIQFQYSNPLKGTIKISGKLDIEDGREEIISRIAIAASVKITKKGEFSYEID